MLREKNVEQKPRYTLPSSVQTKYVGWLHWVISMAAPRVLWWSGQTPCTLLEGPLRSWGGARREARKKHLQPQSQEVLALNHRVERLWQRKILGLPWNISDSWATWGRVPHWVWIFQTPFRLELIQETQYCKRFELEGILELILANSVTSIDGEMVAQKSKELCLKSFW